MPNIFGSIGIALTSAVIFKNIEINEIVADLLQT